MKIYVDRFYKNKTSNNRCNSKKSRTNLESRHLGLFSTLDNKTLYNKIQKVSKTISKNLDIDQIIKILKNTSELQKISKPSIKNKKQQLQ